MERENNIQELNSGEFICIEIIKILSVPSIDTLSRKFPDDEAANAQFQREWNSLLAEVYQIYKTGIQDRSGCQDFSLELLWMTSAAENQTYKAKVAFYIVFRTLAKSQSAARERLSQLVAACQTTLTSGQYEYETIPFHEYSRDLANIDFSSTKAIIKNERLENLQNQLLPQCYGFDRFPANRQSFGRLINSLLNHPNCAISFQLIPTEYSYQEQETLGKTWQALDTLSKGIMESGVGNISFSLAEKCAQTYRYYSQSKTSPLFLYNILVYGNQSCAQSIASSTYNHLLGDNGEASEIRIVSVSGDATNIQNNPYAIPWIANEQLPSYERNASIWSSGYFSPYARFAYIITGEEASGFFRLPIGDGSISAGIVVNESQNAQKTYSAKIVNSGDIDVGILRSSTKGDRIGISLQDLTKHMLIVGTPGSGKTTFSIGLLDRLWKEHGIPFLVIEPAKNEYRALVESIPDLQIFTPGKNTISPFVFNPFVPPKNVKLETYKSTLKTAFAAAVSMSTPLDKIFEETVNNCYSDFRWLDSYTSESGGRIFNITDFIKCFQQTFDSIGYTGDARNIGRAGVVRLNSLATLFDNYHSIPIEDLLQKPTVIELAAIENSDQKALIISLVLLSILAYVNSNYVGSGGLRNVILLEEAHVLLDADINNGQGEANPGSIAQGLVKRMLAEIRSYGVGIAIADQSPRKVSTDVVALTDIKLSFRLVESSDKQIIADSTNMSDSQVKRFAKLKPGDAFLFFNKLEEPEEVITENYRLDKKISITLSDSDIGSLSTYWDDRAAYLRPYPQCGMIQYCQQSCECCRRQLAKEIARRIFCRFFKPDTADFDIVRTVFGQISRLVMAELNEEPFSAELLACVKLQLWRRIQYGTKLRISDTLIENSLRKA